MKKFRMNIDGKEVFGLPGQTILEVARENDIFIPTLCYDERTKIYGACGICVVEVEGNPKLCKACATDIADGMVVMTSTERVLESRKTNLELLVSNHNGDCKGPCSLACPAGTDCQGYVGLIANGEYEKANELIKDKIPLPASIGRVCPHPCEDDCRRALVDEPISIMALKRFAADNDLMADEQYLPEIDEPTGKSVAIIGGGPMGLSAAYFLRQMGHEVTIFDAMPKLGGMLRYGIPEYRLPKEVLDSEIELIRAMGVEIVPDTKVGEDIPFETVRGDFDAVLLGIGAWVSTGVGCPGEDAEGVIGGIDFLRKVVRNEPIDFGEKVAIVGGGNTAMDACRTAVRMGAKEVYNIYRRTKDEMPADMLEIEEAEEEGVIFKNLTNPKEILKDENGHVKQVVLQCMELGEPDESGRRRPVPVEGKTETIDIDTVILAIGQAVDASIFDVDKTRKNAIAYDPDTYMTSMPGVFAGGDCGNDKISIAIEAIADAKKASEVIDSYLNGETIKYEKPFFVERDDITEKTFEDRERICREKADQLSAAERKDNFSEVVFGGLTEEQAVKEANRCLECGCHDYYECKLIELSNQYGVKSDRFCGEKNLTEFEDDHPFIARDPDKCILCGLCVRVCDEVMGVGALGLVNRGFDTVVMPNMMKPLAESGCESCGQCVACCPTGALQEKQTVQKEVPLDTEITETTCSYCSVGCSLDLESYGDMLIKANPDKEGYVNAGICCAKGKWGFDASVLEDKIVDPRIKDGDGFRLTDYHEAFVMMAKKLEAVRVRHGAESIGVAISDRYTNEEAYAIKKFADVIGARTFTFNRRASGVSEVLGLDHEASPNTIDELLSTDVILVPGFIKNRNAVIWNKIKQAAERGASVIVLNTEGAQDEWEFAAKVIDIDNSTEFLKRIAKYLVETGKTSDAEGFDAFVKSLEGVELCDECRSVAEMYAGAKKAMIVYQQNVLSTEAARLIGEIAMLSGHIGTPRDGILEVKPKNNSQGLVDLGIHAGAEAMDGLKGLLIFGEDPTDADLSGLEFLGVSDVMMTETAKKADVVLPGTGFASASGTYTNTERRLMPVEPAIDEDVDFSNWEIAAELAHVFEEEFSFEDEYDISEEMNDAVPMYKYAEEGEILGGALKPCEPKFTAAEDAKLIDELVCTDAMMRQTAERIPTPVKATV
ncbi:NAD(P)-binding protein [Hornefia butyriciproducens]|uniref:NAD(P)-binding protein n=1 Tax=Hornefia butyriciproducens TaxID=2652293 RepID=UPI0023F1DBE7|nr:NAD(P)-binding protein [Hornefia butyriciproducens]MDD6299264.1 NAD(P)-binding protein [Hornefia butyriciproducens]